LYLNDIKVIIECAIVKKEENYFLSKKEKYIKEKRFSFNKRRRYFNDSIFWILKGY